VRAGHIDLNHTTNMVIISFRICCIIGINDHGVHHRTRAGSHQYNQEGTQPRGELGQNKAWAMLRAQAGRGQWALELSI